MSRSPTFTVLCATFVERVMRKPPMFDFPSGGTFSLKGRDLREVEVRPGDLVEVVGENVERDVRHYLGDGAVVEPGFADRPDVLVGHPAAGVDHFAGEADQGVRLAVHGGPQPAVADLVGGQPDRPGDGSVGGDAV